MPEEREVVNDVFVWLKAKCLHCGLHFMVATEMPERHTNESLHCPECGHHGGHFLVWSEPGDGFIFQHIPGKSALIGGGFPNDPFSAN